MSLIFTVNTLSFTLNVCRSNNKVEREGEGEKEKRRKGEEEEEEERGFPFSARVSLFIHKSVRRVSSCLFVRLLF